MGLFRKDSAPKTAEEYRKRAEEHRSAAKGMLFTFLKTGILLVAALAVVLAISIAWFVSNTSVRGSNLHISASNGRRFYLATKANDAQGVYDDNSQPSNLQDALKYFKRIANETIQGLPQFRVGTQHIETGSDNEEYIVGDGDGISLMVNSTSNVKNTTPNGYVGPGSKGEMTFYILPTVAGENTATITVFLAAYGLSKPNNGEVTAQRLTGKPLCNILCGHILLFQGKDAQGNYTGQIKPELGADGTIRFAFPKTDTWVINQPIEMTLYWIWPYRFENMVYPGQPNSVFQTSGDAQTQFLVWVNDNKDNIAYTNESLNKASADMSNSDFAKWSSGYNRGDQLIGDNVAYFIWTVYAEE